MQSYLYEGERIVDTRKLYKGWQMAQIFSKDNVETILSINLLSNFGGKSIGRSFNPKFRSNSTKAIAQFADDGMTTVGRWMSEGEYLAMKSGGKVLEGAGGQTFVTKGGAHVFSSAPKGSVYVEFQVPSNSLLQGGKEGWLKLLGPNATKSQQFMLKKQGGEVLPSFKNLTPILKTK